MHFSLRYEQFAQKTIILALICLILSIILYKQNLLFKKIIIGAKNPKTKLLFIFSVKSLVYAIEKAVYLGQV